MNIKEIIINESRPTTEGWGDDIVDFGKNVATNVGDLATRAGKAAINPETYKQAGRDIAAGAKFAVNNPGQAAYDTAKTVDDAVRAGTNALTFGYADKLDAKMNSMINGTNYDDELKNTYGASADALERSPNASTAGEIASYFVPVAAFNAGMKGANLLSKGISKFAPKAVATSKTGRVAGKVAKGTAGLAGGLAADKAAAAGAKKLDPNNPYVDESKLDFLKKDARGAAASGSKANSLRKAAGKPPAPGSLTPPKMSGGKGPTSPVPIKPAPIKPADASKTSATDTERMSNLEKRVDKVDPSFGRKVGNWATKKAVQGAGLYGLYKVGQYELSPDDSGPHTKKYNDSDYAKQWDAAYKAKQDAEKPAENPNKNTNSRPQNTDTDNGSMFSKDTFKESSTELERVKYLMGYRN